MSAHGRRPRRLSECLINDPMAPVVAGAVPGWCRGGCAEMGGRGPCVPLMCDDQKGGRARVWPLRQIVEAILYLDRAGCAWRYLPDSFPPWPTVYGYFAAWRDDGTLARLHDALRAQVRAAAGRDPEPTAAIIDSQSVRAADTVPKATRGWDNAKKVNGRKRHIAV